jgi:hypothetical protein
MDERIKASYDCARRNEPESKDSSELGCMGKCEEGRIVGEREDEREDVVVGGVHRKRTEGGKEARVEGNESEMKRLCSIVKSVTYNVRTPCS